MTTDYALNEGGGNSPPTTADYRWCGYRVAARSMKVGGIVPPQRAALTDIGPDPNSRSMKVGGIVPPQRRRRGYSISLSGTLNEGGGNSPPTTVLPAGIPTS